MYNPQIIDHFSNPRNVGEIDNPDAEITIGSPVCGDMMVVHINWDESKRVSEVVFKAHGCATTIATASMFGEHIRGKTCQEIAATPESQRSRLLGELEPSQHHCLDMLHRLFTQLLESQRSS